jgi:hypothetical protein
VRVFRVAEITSDSSSNRVLVSNIVLIYHKVPTQPILSSETAVVNCNHRDVDQIAIKSHLAAAIEVDSEIKQRCTPYTAATTMRRKV